MAANGSIVYTLTSVFHEYKDTLSELEVETHVYTTKKQAREAMLSLARCQYKESDNIQGSRNKSRMGFL
ncbi:hypothetical protein K7432_016319 [Basidiobolus ranarum]|uniref:Uncharacterized protein n=1 Tax=Basidiobolus ranarum TaxID=34480 RepID=A0ABR2VLS0_9FUNG